MNFEVLMVVWEMIRKTNNKSIDGEYHKLMDWFDGGLLWVQVINRAVLDAAIFCESKSK